MSFGTICAVLAFFGIVGQSMSHVCVDIILVPLGMVTDILLMAGRLFLTAAVMARKLSVAPESSIAKFRNLSW